MLWQPFDILGLGLLTYCRSAGDPSAVNEVFLPAAFCDLLPNFTLAVGKSHAHASKVIN